MFSLDMCNEEMSDIRDILMLRYDRKWIGISIDQTTYKLPI